MINKKNRRAFTLVEMMIVVAIISVLAGIAIPQYNKYIKKAEIVEAIHIMKQILDGEILYEAIHGEYKAFERSDAINNSDMININNVLGTAVPSDSKFKYFTVKVCDYGTIIISAISDINSISGTVYYVYGNIGDYTTNKYQDNYYLHDYINNEINPNIAPTQCRYR